MSFTITYLDIINTVIVALAIVVVVYLVKALKGVAESTKKINGLIDGNRKNIDETIASLPKICKNVEDITSSLKGKTDLIDNFVSSREEAAAPDSANLESLISSISSVVDVFSEISGLFARRRRKSK